MHEERAVVFAEREGFRALELDLYRPSPDEHRPSPDQRSDKLRPLLVYVHGGGWRMSHRSRAPRETRAWLPGFFERLTDAEFVVATPAYRFSDEARFPAQIDDTVEALRWLHGQADALGVDAARTYLWGASAGGHLAALAALLLQAPTIAGVVCWYPITDLLTLDHQTSESFEAHLLGGPIGDHLDAARAASPMAHVRQGAPPFLLQHGERDSWVPVDQSVRFADALRAAGGSVELDVVAGANHFFDGAQDVESIFDRARTFLSDIDAALLAS
jgi:acetyl esterase/lipase